MRVTKIRNLKTVMIIDLYAISESLINCHNGSRLRVLVRTLSPMSSTIEWRSFDIVLCIIKLTAVNIKIESNSFDRCYRRALTTEN